MTQAGLAKIDLRLLYKSDAKPAPKNGDPSLPQFMKQALITNPKAWEFFKTLAPSYRKLYVRWILSARKQATRKRRLQEAVSLLQQNKKLGLK